MKRQCFLSNYNDLPDCIVKTMNVLDNIQIASVCRSIKPIELVTAISRLNVTDFSNKFRKSQITTVYMNSAMTKPIFRPIYCKACVKRPLSKRQKIGFKTNYRLIQVKSIAEGSKRVFCSTFDLKLPFVIKIFVLSIFEWPF